MTSLNQIFGKADRALVDEVQKLHVGAQVWRFLRITLFAFATTLPVSTAHLGWSALASLGAGALEAGFRQLYPSLPLNKTTSVVTAAVKEQATALATAAINEHVDNYQANALLQKTVTQLLATSTTPVASQRPEPSAAVPAAAPPAA